MELGIGRSVEATGRLLGVVLGAAYGAGVLVTDIYLTAHGVHSYSLVRSEYILAGLLWFFLCCFPVIWFLWARAEWQSLRTELASRRYGAAAFSTILLPVSFVMFPYFFLTQLSRQRLNPGEVAFYLAIASLGGCAFAGWATFRDLRAFAGDHSTARGARLYQFLWGPVSLLASITLYASSTYPTFDAAIGGGHRDPVYVIVSPQAPRDLLFGLPRSRQRPHLVGPVELLFESDHDFFLLPAPPREGDHAIMIPRELVQGVLPSAS